MDAKDFRKALEKAEDKLKMFSEEELGKYKLSYDEIEEAIRDFLKDEEILKLFEYPKFINFDSYKRKKIISFIKDKNIKWKIFESENILNEFDAYEIKEILRGMSDEKIQQFLYSEKFIKKHNLSEGDIIYIIIETCSQNMIKENILKGDFSSGNTERLLKALDAKNLKDFFINNKDFLEERNIQPYEIIAYMDSDKQKEFLEFLEEANLTMDEKRKIFATLKPEVKESIDKTNLPKEYIEALDMERKKYVARIIVNLNGDLEKYRGLDDLIRIDGEKLTEEERKNFIKLCNICPNLSVACSIGDISDSTGKEYKEAEEWIESVIGKLKPEYSKAQKLAIIDYEIGKKISYGPANKTEVEDTGGYRALWKIIASGDGVCNGIALVEKYILDRVGIESEIVSSGTHSFLKIKNIELPLANGETIKGNTILDPTWNLASHRFGTRPYNFCISYEEARENDINSKGEDKKCHQNDEELANETIGLEEEVLRKIFSSVGLADKEGKFPIGDMMDKSEELHKKYKGNPEEDLKNQFLLLAEKCPEFATCQESTTEILKDILLDSENLDYRCMVKRVYDKNDKEKRPVLFVYIDLEEAGEKFYYADKETGQMINLSKEEFIEKFDCYEYDLEKNNGKRFWEIEENKEKEKDLATSSGNIEKKESEGR